MGEDICGWELFLKALCRFIRVGRKCSYIDEASHPGVRPRRSYDRAAVRVPNQDYGTADPLQSPSHVGDILGVRIESVLRCDHLMSLGQKGRDEFAEARAVCPQAVDEDDAGFALICHNFPPFVQLEVDCLSRSSRETKRRSRNKPRRSSSSYTATPTPSRTPPSVWPILPLLGHPEAYGESAFRASTDALASWGNHAAFAFGLPPANVSSPAPTSTY